MVEELRPTEFPSAFGCFFFLFFLFFLFIFLLFKSQREPLLTPLKRPRAPQRGRPPHRGPHGPPCWPRPDEVSRPRGPGRVSPSKRSFCFMILVFNFNHSAHIKESVFDKQKANPEMYIWDDAKATEEWKPQVPCFKLTASPRPCLGSWRLALVDLCTDLYIASFLRRPFWRA